MLKVTFIPSWLRELQEKKSPFWDNLLKIILWTLTSCIRIVAGLLCHGQMRPKYNQHVRQHEAKHLIHYPGIWSNRLNSATYHDIPVQPLAASARTPRRGKIYFQIDTENIVLQWTYQSLDLNPAEDLWSVKVYVHKPKNIRETDHFCRWKWSLLKCLQPCKILQDEKQAVISCQSIHFKDADPF